MRKARHGFMALGLLLCLATSAPAGISIGISLPSVSIGINLPLFPELAPVPGYPVYYAPRVDGNYFFYDGLYWVYWNDNWYASSWYNGPWGYVDPAVVPLFVLRIPVGYYRRPPAYFGGWQRNAPPRWGEHWGRGWEQRRSGWDRWKRGSAPARAPLPVYQRRYAGAAYPKPEQQKTLRRQQYRYQPRDKVVREHLKQVDQKPPGSRAAKPETPRAGAPQRDNRRQTPQTHPARQQKQPPAQQRQGTAPSPASQPQRRGNEPGQRPAPVPSQPRQQVQPAPVQRAQPAPAQHQQHAPQAAPHQQRGAGEAPERGHGGQGQEQHRDEGRGR
ncbi:hypothetical protein GMSM_20370 [Geomonas sp. Red276]